jgi:transglutaminase-like putative cysteine protease
MRLSIDHRTRYHFSEPQTRVVQLLRMTPRDDGAQTVISWSIDVDCDARLREGRDGYGNITTMLYIDGPIPGVEIIVRGEVVTDGHAGLVTGVAETLPAGLFLRASAVTQADEVVRTFADVAMEKAHQPADRAHALNRAIYQRLKLTGQRTDKNRTARQTLAERTGNVRDAAHLMLAAARGVGLPARFVSGHCLDGPFADSHHSSHCWTEVFVEGTGWIGFDPSTGRNPGDSYVRVAIGLDASDATPLSGTRTGGGIEELDVAVRVAAEQEQ